MFGLAAFQAGSQLRCLKSDSDSLVPLRARVSACLRGTCQLEKYGFWRVLMDEAQVVASVSSTVTEMASRLWRRHAWVVTGTPLVRDHYDFQVCSPLLQSDAEFQIPALYSIGRSCSHLFVDIMLSLSSCQTLIFRMLRKSPHFGWLIRAESFGVFSSRAVLQLVGVAAAGASAS